MIQFPRALSAGALALALTATVLSAQTPDPGPSPQATTYAPDAAAPPLQTAVVATPVRSARHWSTGLSPNARGSWNFITQLYEYQSPHPAEYVVLDLQTGKHTITEGRRGQYTNSNYQWNNQARARNGRIFFSEMNCFVTYYDPQDETIKTLGQVIDSKDGDKIIFRWAFGADGKLYGSTQANKLPTVVRIDPETLEYKVIGRVGKNRLSYSYGYYLAVDPTPSAAAPEGWVYVGVGQTPWELAALNIATGEQKILATREDAGWVSFDRKPEGLVGKLSTGMRRPDWKTDLFWLADGEMYPYEANYDATKLPFKPRNVQPVSAPLDAAPELDLTEVNADAGGVGRVRWRPAGSTDEKAWQTVPFSVKHTAPVELESLIALPDGTLLGNSKQYHGFFRYDPRTGRTETYGEHGPSRGPRLVVGNTVYIAGYPGSVLYALDPTKPWTSNRRAEMLLEANPKAAGEPLNPSNLGIFRTHTDTHYASFLLPSRSGRLYFAGRRERTGTGGGIGWYHPATKTFGGHHQNLSFLTPRGLVVLDDLSRVVYSGQLQDDPALPGKKPAEAQLVVYDMELKELERVTVKPGMKDTGALYPAASGTQLIGIVEQGKTIYRYDLAAKKLLDWIELPSVIEEVARRDADGSLWLVAGGSLLRLDAASMQLQTVGKLPFSPGILAWQGADLYLVQGPELHKVSSKLPSAGKA